jgi:hypothetical protein
VPLVPKEAGAVDAADEVRVDQDLVAESRFLINCVWIPV